MGADVAADRAEIAHLLADYCAGIDDRDFDLVASAFTDDAVLDYTSSGGPKAARDEVVAWLREALSAVDLTQHFLTNVRVDVDGDTATSHAYFFHPLLAGEARFTMGGTYADRLVRTADGWRIAERVQELRWTDPPLPT